MQADNNQWREGNLLRMPLITMMMIMKGGEGAWTTVGVVGVESGHGRGRGLGRAPEIIEIMAVAAVAAGIPDRGLESIDAAVRRRRRLPTESKRRCYPCITTETS